MFDKLKKFKGWWHYLKNSWLIRTSKDANQIMEYLQSELDDDINLLIVEVGPDYQGWLSEKAWKWIDRNIGDESA
ncbi:MAG: hypothetical protein KZQ97_04365 [Candidatus Thiodiazotropha sp. (ex Dulcina madagascariensis)]|nr:hypothetical protein [Candidatus Thiodiazotropha sp. (ex Dulcina madagascariensis)]